MLSIEEEIIINETSDYRIIGMTLETRPDFVTKYSIKDYRRYGVTRIQIYNIMMMPYYFSLKGKSWLLYKRYN